LAKAARDHVIDSNKNGIVGHTSSDGSGMGKRIQRYTKLEGMSGENIQYGKQSAQEVILALIVDDGVASRGHRTNIYQKGFKKIGTWTGDHPKFGQHTVLDYNGSNAKMTNLLAKKVEVLKPAGAKSWSSSTKVNYKGDQMIKTTTYDFLMRDGSHQKKVVVDKVDV
jgi:hypothetical protein